METTHISVYWKYYDVCLYYRLYTKMLRIYLFSIFTSKTPWDLIALTPVGLIWHNHDVCETKIPKNGIPDE